MFLHRPQMAAAAFREGAAESGAGAVTNALKIHSFVTSQRGIWPRIERNPALLEIRTNDNFIRPGRRKSYAKLTAELNWKQTRSVERKRVRGVCVKFIQPVDKCLTGIQYYRFYPAARKILDGVVRAYAAVNRRSWVRASSSTVTDTNGTLQFTNDVP